MRRKLSALAATVTALSVLGMGAVVAHEYVAGDNPPANITCIKLDHFAPGFDFTGTDYTIREGYACHPDLRP